MGPRSPQITCRQIISPSGWLMRLSHLLFSMRPPRLPTLEVTLSPSPFPSPPLPLPLSLCRSLYFDSRRSATSSGSLLFGYHVSSQRDKRLSVTAWRKYLSLHERLRFSLCMRLSVCSVASARVLTERPLLCMQAKRVSLNLQLGEASNRCSQSAFGRPSLRYTPLNRMNRSGVVIALVVAGLSAAYGLSEEQLQQLGLGTGPPEGARRAVAAASPQGLAGWEGAIPAACRHSPSCERWRVRGRAVQDHCADSSNYCREWALRGECDRNPRYMLQGCRKSCKRCIPKHVRPDTHPTALAPQRNATPTDMPDASCRLVPPIYAPDGRHPQWRY